MQKSNSSEQQNKNDKIIMFRINSFCMAKKIHSHNTLFYNDLFAALFTHFYMVRFQIKPTKGLIANLYHPGVLTEKFNVY